MNLDALTGTDWFVIVVAVGLLAGGAPAAAGSVVLIYLLTRESR
jgi:hypothetical protein